MLECRYYDLCCFTDDSCNGEQECPKRERCQFYSPMPDVEALAALAKVLHDMGEHYDVHGRYELGTTFKAIAERIRKCIGR